MKKRQKSILVLAVMVAFVGSGLFLPELIGAGDLEPGAGPGPTMKTLDEITPTWSQTLTPASERFVLVLNDEAVLDKETGLVWARDANWIVTNNPTIDQDGTPGDGRITWEHAVTYCRDFTIGNRKGWRLPTVEEMASLNDMTGPAYFKLSSGFESIFLNTLSLGMYWTSTANEFNTAYAWSVVVWSGETRSNILKYGDYYVWPVRGGN